jgi:hypothetical protein
MRASVKARTMKQEARSREKKRREPQQKAPVFPGKP